jgi:hypothetical protein
VKLPKTLDFGAELRRTDLRAGGLARAGDRCYGSGHDPHDQDHYLLHYLLTFVAGRSPFPFQKKLLKPAGITPVPKDSFHDNDQAL